MSIAVVLASSLRSTLIAAGAFLGTVVIVVGVCVAVLVLVASGGGAV